jgi:hypothetical protein
MAQERRSKGQAEGRTRVPGAAEGWRRAQGRRTWAAQPDANRLQPRAAATHMHSLSLSASPQPSLSTPRVNRDWRPWTLTPTCGMASDSAHDAQRRQQRRRRHQRSPSPRPVDQPAPAASLLGLPLAILERLRSCLPLGRPTDADASDQQPTAAFGLPALDPHLALARTCRALWAWYARDRGAWWVDALERLGYGVRAATPDRPPPFFSVSLSHTQPFRSLPSLC